MSRGPQGPGRRGPVRSYDIYAATAFARQSADDPSPVPRVYSCRDSGGQWVP